MEPPQVGARQDPKRRRPARVLTNSSCEGSYRRPPASLRRVPCSGANPPRSMCGTCLRRRNTPRAHDATPLGPAQPAAPTRGNTPSTPRKHLARVCATTLAPTQHGRRSARYPPCADASPSAQTHPSPSRRRNAHPPLEPDAFAPARTKSPLTAPSGRPDVPWPLDLQSASRRQRWSSFA